MVRKTKRMTEYENNLYELLKEWTAQVREKREKW